MRGLIKRFLVIFILGSAVTLAHAECDSCMLYGEDHAFALAAPPGWVLDTISGVFQGLHQVFYPRGETWSSSPVVAYSRARTKNAKVRTVQDQVSDTLADFRPGSPNIKAEHAGVIPLGPKKEAQIYHFTGDQWENFEAVAYIDEPKTINFIVLSSRDHSVFNRSLGAFKNLVRSYVFVGDNAATIRASAELTKQLPETFEKAVTIGKMHENGRETRVYHSKTLIPFFGPKLASVLKSCFDQSSKPDARPFGFVTAIGSDGKVLRIYKNTETAIFSCVKQHIREERFPKPPISPYFMHIEMNFAP